MNEDITLTEAMMIEKGHRQISGDELKQLLFGNSILGDFGFAFKYLMTIASDGALEGINNLGSHHFGNLTIDHKANTLTVRWMTGWVHSTSRAYHADGKVKLFNVENGQWSTTFTEILKGTEHLMVPPTGP